MKITEETVEKLAHLARLEFKQEEKAVMAEEMSRMLDFVDQLNQVNTDGIEPLIYMSDATNVMRNDEVKVMISHQEALKNAPKKDSDFIRVPKVIDQK